MCVVMNDHVEMCVDSRQEAQRQHVHLCQECVKVSEMTCIHR